MVRPGAVPRVAEEGGTVAAVSQPAEHSPPQPDPCSSGQAPCPRSYKCNDAVDSQASDR